MAEQYIMELHESDIIKLIATIRGWKQKLVADIPMWIHGSEVMYSVASYDPLDPKSPDATILLEMAERKGISMIESTNGTWLATYEHFSHPTEPTRFISEITQQKVVCLAIIGTTFGDTVDVGRLVPEIC